MANLSALSGLLILLLLISSAESHSSSKVVVGTTQGAGGVADQREFDYFLLSLQWKGSICQRTRYCCSSNGCCRSSGATGFTIHGLWTDYNDGTWPACCNAAKPFDINEITPLLEGLQKYWPSLSCSSTSTCHGGRGLFWAHEWEKHGTCSYPVFRDEYSYFLATLNLYLKYNVTEILIENGYVASNTEMYPLGGIVSAIQNAVRATPQITCRSGAIEEVHLCFYKDFQPRDCVAGGSWYASSSCPRYVSLPEYVPWSLPGARIPWSSDAEAI